MDEEAVSVDALPDSLLRRVFALLPPEDLVHLCRVSKRWSAVSWSTPFVSAWALVHPKHLPSWSSAPLEVREALLLSRSSSELLKGPDVDSAALGLDLPSLLRRRLLPSQLHALRRPTWNCFLACLLQSEARFLELLHDRSVPVQTLLVHPGPLDGLLKHDAADEVLAGELPRHLLLNLHMYGAPLARRRMLSSPGLASANLSRISGIDIYRYTDMQSCAHTVSVPPYGSTRIPVSSTASLEAGSELFEWQEERLARVRVNHHIIMYMWHRVAHLKAGAPAESTAAAAAPPLPRWRRNHLAEEVLTQASRRGWLQPDDATPPPWPRAGPVDGVHEVAVGDCLLFAMADRTALPDAENTVLAMAGVPCDFWKQDLRSLFAV
jgi:hypothetical protein